MLTAGKVTQNENSFEVIIIRKHRGLIHEFTDAKGEKIEEAQTIADMCEAIATGICGHLVNKMQQFFPNKKMKVKVNFEFEEVKG